MPGPKKVEWGKTKRKKEVFGPQILELLKAGLTLQEACAVVGIHISSVYRWAEADEKFAKELELAREYYKAWIKTTMYKTLKILQNEGDHRTVLKHLEWLAERVLRDQFATKQVVEEKSEKMQKWKDEIVKALLAEIKGEPEDKISIDD